MSSVTICFFCFALGKNNSKVNGKKRKVLVGGH